MLRAVAASVLFSLAAATGAVAAERLAMVIGNGDYAGLPPVRTAVADAELVGHTLEAAGFKVVSLKDVTGAGLGEAVDKFGAAVTDDAILVLYYAGHGVMAGGQPFLIPVDVSASLPDLPGAPLDAVVERLRKASKVPVIAFFDASRQGKVEGTDGQVRSIWGATEAGQVPANVAVGFATAPGRAVLDSGAEHGAYASALAGLLPQPGLSVMDLLQAVRQEVSEATAGKQTPWDQSSLRDKIVLAGK